ncbi:MAG: hypothetical protein MZU97_16450 [Bacillus subtilis]|nr:hypothetical protein [Bacillus subtilis]
MRTSIKSRLFLSDVRRHFGVHRRIDRAQQHVFSNASTPSQRQKTLVSAFEVVKDVDLTAADFSKTVVLEIENEYSINIQSWSTNPIPKRLPIRMADWAVCRAPYDAAFRQRDVFARQRDRDSILAEFERLRPQDRHAAHRGFDVADAETYSAFLAELTPDQRRRRRTSFDFSRFCVRETPWPTATSSTTF